MINMIDALEWRYAVKKFDEDFFLEPALLDIIKKAFSLNASSYGLQPYELLIVENKELQQQLSQHSFNQQQPAQAAAVLVFCIKTDFNDAYIEQYFKLIATQRGTPTEALEGYKSFMKGVFSKKTKEEITLWATKQVYLAMGTLLTVCAALEIDSCPMEGFNPQGVDALLNLNEKNLQSVLLMPIGKRADDDLVAHLKKVRKPLEDTVRVIS